MRNGKSPQLSRGLIGLRDEVESIHPFSFA
jgi:hypothetical protein